MKRSGRASDGRRWGGRRGRAHRVRGSARRRQTSMLQDLEQERALELDPIFGAVIELAERYGVATPSVREAYGELRG